MFVDLLLLSLPATNNFMHMFSRDVDRRPKQPSSPLVPWKYVQSRIAWGLVFLLGAGFAMAEASKRSGLTNMIARYLRRHVHFQPFPLLVIVCLTSSFLTQFAANIVVVDIVIPILAEMAMLSKIHPMYLIMPSTLCCSYAFCLPISTPPNALASDPCHMTSSEMLKIGFFVTIGCMACCLAFFPTFGPYIWDTSKFPDWAK